MEKESLHTAYGLFVHAAILLGLVIAENVFHTGHLELAMWLIGIAAFATTLILNFNRIRAHFRQLFVAKLRGFWQDEALNKQVKKYFNESEIIKIKVTRGSIFLDTNNAFNQCIMKKNEKTATTNEIKILLHYPCQNSKHLDTRAKAHGEKDKDYLAKLYKIVFELLEAKQKFKLNLTIRLYGDQQIKWRFYVFKNVKGRKTLFLGYYNDHKGGNLTPMIKVKGSGHDDPNYHTLCDDFDKEFDDVFENKSFDIEEVFKSEIHTRQTLLECLKDTEACKVCHENFKTKIQSIIDTFGLNNK